MVCMNVIAFVEILFLGRSGQFLCLTSHSPIKHRGGFQYHQPIVSMESFFRLSMPFPGCLLPRCQNEASCEAIHMKIKKLTSVFHASVLLLIMDFVITLPNLSRCGSSGSAD